MKPLNRLHIDSPLGSMTLAASERGLCGAWFDGQRHGPSLEQIHSWTNTPDDPLLLQAAEQLHAYFSSQRKSFDLPLDLSRGTAFQQSVWQALLQVDCGQHQSYGDLARQLNNAKAVRAVGAAVGRNPITIIVPCHRILGAGGQLTGYAGGLWRKGALLQLENQLMGSLMPYQP
jgi:methylated-DNA-[protein]-cysteine S-methyltransferase